MVESAPLKERIYTIIFGTDTPAGRWFDLLLIISIVLSVLAIALDSIESVNRRFGPELLVIEWTFTLLFSLEYLLRLYCSRNTRAYAVSFYGLVDLCTILPTYISLLIPGAQQFAVLRVLRVMRIFRVLKLARFMSETSLLSRSMYAARRKITVFLFALLSIITIVGAIMYVVEGPAHGFTSLPRSIYWAIVTLTTVGYGDITPQTPLGQFIAGISMIVSYAIIAIPTGIISAELINEAQKQRAITRCQQCERMGHETDADYCRFCGADLPEAPDS